MKTRVWLPIASLAAALLATSGVHHHLVREGTRTLAGLVIVLKTPETPWPVPESLADVLALLSGLTFAITNALLLKLKDGRELSIHVKAVLGTAQNPMTRAQVDEKCYHLMAPILGKARARKLCDAIWNIEKVGDIRALRALLSA